MAEKKAKAPKKEKKSKKGAAEEQEVVQPRDYISEDADKNKKGKKGDKNAEKVPKVKVKHPALTATLRTSAVFAVLILVFSVLVFLDIFSLKQTVLQALNPDLDPEVVFQSYLVDLRFMETENENRANELDRESALLDDREQKISDAEDKIAVQVGLLGGTIDDDGNINFPGAKEIPNGADIESVAKMIEKMTPKSAAAMFINMTSIEMQAAVLDKMKPAKAGAVLDEMSETDAAQIIELMLTPQSELG